MQIKLIFTRKVLRLVSFWKWEFLELGNGYIWLYRAFSHDVTAAILVSQNNEAAAMLVSLTNPLGVKLFSYASAFFCSNKFA